MDDPMAEAWIGAFRGAQRESFAVAVGVWQRSEDARHAAAAANAAANAAAANAAATPAATPAAIADAAADGIPIDPALFGAPAPIAQTAMAAAPLVAPLAVPLAAPPAPLAAPFAAPGAVAAARLLTADQMVQMLRDHEQGVPTGDLEAAAAAGDIAFANIFMLPAQPRRIELDVRRHIRQAAYAFNQAAANYEVRPAHIPMVFGATLLRDQKNSMCLIRLGQTGHQLGEVGERWLVERAGDLDTRRDAAERLMVNPANIALKRTIEAFLPTYWQSTDKHGKPRA